jgi:hypothetical protein
MSIPIIARTTITHSKTTPTLTELRKSSTRFRIGTEFGFATSLAFNVSSAADIVKD